MQVSYLPHNRFRQNLAEFRDHDPHLQALAALKHQFSPDWWADLDVSVPGIYILTGGRQVGKSTSCKLLIKDCLENKRLEAENVFYLPCDEIFDARSLSETLRTILEDISGKRFLLIIDEVTYVKGWDRVIKALADEGVFTRGVCILTGSDTSILKESAMRFPGRRGNAEQVDFHLYPLTFAEYVKLLDVEPSTENLANLFQNYLQCGGYLRAINNLAMFGKILPATFQTYEQWIRGDFLKQGKKEDYLLAVLRALLTVGASQISYSSLTQKIGLLSKETCIDYCRLLERMDILIHLQAFDVNKKQGFPRKDRKFHFFDPFIFQTVYRWLQREGQLNTIDSEPTMVEACVASHCCRFAKSYYFKGQGEVDVIMLRKNNIQAIEVKWSSQLRATDLKSLRHFEDSIILTKNDFRGVIDGIQSLPVFDFLYHLT